MEKMFELGFVCQVILNAGKVVSLCVRDARSGQLLYVGIEQQEMVDSLLKCIDSASRSMDAQVKAMENA